jgi:hypothetical protein
MIEISSSNQLMDELRKGSGQIIHLAGGDYYLDSFPQQSVTLTGAGVFDTRVHVLATPQFQQQSNLSALCFVMTEPDIPLMNMDRMAHSFLDKVWFIGAPYADNSGKDWSEVKHRGLGVVNPNPDGDNNYKIIFRDCYFYGLDEAVSLRGNPKARREFANALWFERCTWNACGVAAYLDRIGESYLGWCMTQCCEFGLIIRGNSNLIDRFHMERGMTDVRLLQGSYYNEFNLYCNPRRAVNEAPSKNENVFRFLKTRQMMKTLSIDEGDNSDDAI